MGQPIVHMLTGNEEHEEPANHEESYQTHSQLFQQYASQSNPIFPEHSLSHNQLSPNKDMSNNFTHHHPRRYRQLNQVAQNTIQHSHFDPRAFTSASSASYPQPPLPQTPQPNNSFLSVDPLLLVPKAEEFTANNNTRLGLNLGGSTYFSTDDDFVNSLYRRSTSSSSLSNSPKCQAEGCIAELSNAKHYHKRHKVCEFHSKASTVIAARFTQRFCQQCSRFHVLSEFDNGKRSCRKRLADHNHRRRKNQQPSQENQKTQEENARDFSSNNFSRSHSDSAGAYPSSSVTVAVSPPDYFQPRPYQNTSSSTKTSSPFFSSGGSK